MTTSSFYARALRTPSANRAKAPIRADFVSAGAMPDNGAFCNLQNAHVVGDSLYEAPQGSVKDRCAPSRARENPAAGVRR